MAKKGMHYHDGLVPAEIIIIRIFFIVLGLFIVGAIIVQGFNSDLFTRAAISQGFFTRSWDVLVTIWKYWLGTFFIVLNLFLFGIFVVSLIKAWPYREHQKLVVWGLKPSHAHGPSHGIPGVAGAKIEKNPLILKHWTEIVRKANTGLPENLRGAVVEADALTDLFLRQAGYAGDTMADRLMQLNKDQIKSLDRLWDAHRLRNEIAHTPGFVVESKDAQRALVAIRDFLKEMEAF